jgi:D-alanyl-D-alanine carboxypeptidase
MKRILSFILFVVFFFGLTPVIAPSSSEAESFDKSGVYEPYYILVNADKPSVSYRGIEKEADTRVFPASTTKILTCIIALEEGNLDDMVTVSAKAVDFGRGNSLMGLQEGDTYSLRDLLYGMMLPSGNDAAIAIAEHIAGSTDAFADKMNEKAKQIGMTHSHFVTVHGKHNEDHYTTVRDMALLTSYALTKSEKKDAFRTIVGTAYYTAKSGPRTIELINSNRLLADVPPTEDFPNPISCLYEYAIGVKTGDTTPAGKCLIAAAEKDNVTLIAVLYGGTLDDPEYNSGWTDARKDKYNARRFQDAKAMFEYAFSDMNRSIRISELVSGGLKTTFETTIPNAAEDDPENGRLVAQASLSAESSVTMMIVDPDAKPSDLEIEVSPTFTSTYAPIHEGDKVGTVTYKYLGKTILTADLIATRGVKRGNTQINIDPQGTDPQQGGSMIGEKDASSVSGNGQQEGTAVGGESGNNGWILIALAIVGVILIAIIILFVLYVRAESKRRRRAAARKRAAQRARDSQNYYDR